MAKETTRKEHEKGPRVLLHNRKARHLYDLSEAIEAGIELKGSEVKSLREGGGSIAESWVGVRGGELYVMGMTIPPFSKAGAWNEPQTRERRLLLHKREIAKYAGASTVKGMTIVPTKVYLNARGKVKVEIALGRGRSQGDKRAAIRERDVKRELEREYKLK